MPQEEWMDFAYDMKHIQHLARAVALRKQNYPDITTSEFAVMTQIFVLKEQATPQMLAQNTQMQKPVISRLLERLLSKKFITKTINPRDRRSYHVSLTDEGLQVLEKAYIITVGPLYRLRDVLGAEEYAHFISLIDTASCEIEQFYLNLNENPRP